jgi:multidomain signaling protein FimX
VNTTINILAITDTTNDIDTTVSVLRNSGTIANYTHADDEDGMKNALLTKKFDIAVCEERIEDIEPLSLIRLLKQNKINIPLIVLIDEFDEELTVEYLQIGAHDAVSSKNHEHLKLVILRELKSLEYSRQFESLEKQLKETEDRCESLMENSQDAIAYIQEGTHIAANSVYLSKFGYDDPDDLIGIPVLDMVDPAEHKKFKDFLRAYAKQDNVTTNLDIKGQMPDGSTFDALLEFSPATIEGENCTQVTIREKADSKDLEARIEHLSTLDLLTGLFNRQYFMKQLAAFLEKHKGTPSPDTALIYIILDDFRAIRNSIGIATSDEVLIEVAEILTGMKHQSEMLARFDDHVFTLLVPEKTADMVRKYADTICHQIKEHQFQRAGQFVTTECSIGVEFYANHVQNAQEFVYNADSAAESARMEGGDQVRVHNPISKSSTDEGEDSSEHSLEAIRYAIANDRFALLYQPIVGLQGDASENYCVLLRMLDEEDELILPKDFLPSAIKHNYMQEIDEWVIENALKTLSERRAKGREINLFIKVTGASLGDKLILKIVDCMKRFKIHGNWIIFEIDDVEIRSHLKQTKIFLSALKKLKCRFALDCFGIEENIEAFIQQIPADFIKIDGSLIGELPSKEDNQKLVRKINELSHECEIKTIAKSVEDANTLAFLWSSSVDYIQGYFLQEPSNDLSYDFSGDDDDDDDDDY